jgi:hypothetical protein
MNCKNSAVKCQCKYHVDRRFKSYVSRAHSAGLGAPPNAEQLVVVRQYTVKAHYRRHPGYKINDPGLLEAIRDFANAMREIHDRAKKGTLVSRRPKRKKAAQVIHMAEYAHGRVS